MNEKIRKSVMQILLAQDLRGFCAVKVGQKEAMISSTKEKTKIEGDPVLISECVRLVKKESKGTLNKVNTGNYLRTNLAMKGNTKKGVKDETE